MSAPAKVQAMEAMIEAMRRSSSCPRAAAASAHSQKRRCASSRRRSHTWQLSLKPR